MRTKTISATILIVLLIGGFIYWEYFQEQGFLRIGIEIPSTIALWESSLASKISSTATSMTLTSGIDKDGNSISGKFGFILDEGSSDEEFVIADCSGTACTNMLRGISVTTGGTEVAALQKSHGRGASVKMTDYPLLTILQQLTSGSASFEDLLYYSETIGTTGFASVASSSDLASKYYVDYVGAGGFTSLNVGTSYGLKALGTSPETVGIDLLTNASGLAFSGGDLYVYTSASQGLSFDDAGRLFFNASNSFAFTGTNTFTGSTTISTLTLTNPLDETYGGTGSVSWDKYDLLFATADNTLGNIASGSDNQVLTMAEGVPTWSNLSPNYLAGVLTGFAHTAGTGDLDHDQTITTNFTPRFIKLTYYMQGNQEGGNGVDHQFAKTIFQGTTPIMTHISAQKTSNGADNGVPTIIVKVFQTTPATCGTNSGTGILTTLTINSTSSTGFVIRVAVDEGSTAAGTARFYGFWEAW